MPNISFKRQASEYHQSGKYFLRMEPIISRLLSGVQHRKFDAIYQHEIILLDKYWLIAFLFIHFPTLSISVSLFKNVSLSEFVFISSTNTGIFIYFILFARFRSDSISLLFPSIYHVTHFYCQFIRHMEWPK